MIKATQISQLKLNYTIILAVQSKLQSIIIVICVYLYLFTVNIEIIPNSFLTALAPLLLVPACGWICAERGSGGLVWPEINIDDPG